jgi:hypothetical protein
MSTARNLAALARSVSSTGELPFNYRNRIINPGMQISQERGTAQIAISTGSAYTVDQWRMFVLAGGPLAAQQVASVTPAGSPFRLRHNVQIADASIVADDYYYIEQNIEGQMFADARFGTASARQIVIRFGVRSSLAGTFGVRLTNSAANRSYVTTFTVAGGEINTDLLRTFVIPGDTTGTWLTDTGRGVTMNITLAAGTTFQTTAGSWQAGNFLTTSAQTNFMGTAGATFELFDVGLYVDALNIGAAPAWELPDFSNELMRCLRYWENGRAINYTAIAGVTQVQSSVPFKQIKRVAPVIGALTGSHSSVNITTTEFAINITSTIIDTPWTASARF